MHKWAALFLLLTACKGAGSGDTAEAEALDYVRLANVAISNAYYETGQPVPPTPCTDPLFGLKKTSKFLKLQRCVARKDSADSVLIAAVFNDDLAIVSDAQGTRRVKVEDLPEVER